MCIHHKDHNKKNNCVDNLVQITYLEHNNIHAHPAWNKGISWSVDHIKKIKKIRALKAKENFRETFVLKEKGYSCIEIANLLNLNRRTVYDRLKRYKEVINAI